MKELLLIGGGGHCKSIIDVIEEEGSFSIAGIIDKSDLLGKTVLGYPIIGSDSDLNQLAKKFTYALVTVGQIKSPNLRIKLFKKAKESGFILPSIVSPRAYVSKHATIGDGTVVMHYALVNANARIGKNCIINTMSLVEHDSLIGDNCHLSTNTIINGGVVMGQGSFIGSNSTTKEGIKIDENSFIRAGSVVQ
ncbi:acetyltransferase [Candidatus Woesearchaeota archaeon]|jgi:sugar O-acyltransferase (sialic acid O-acetyltransferase NeuD family)|nr:acetyltransferase [Candidatus Woesearchaeota archaeon]